jgi:Kinesin motor domain/Regulator of chromosome condensation (RCC1) repeat
MKKRKENIKVCIRMRPLLRPYEDEEIWSIDKNSISSRPIPLNPMDLSSASFVSLKERDIRRRYADSLGQNSFTFDHIYSINDTSEKIYNDICKPIVEYIMEGFNGAVFMYGQTTSGKTYTMLGRPDLPGILPLSIQDIFNLSLSSTTTYTIWVSYLEIYNEQINDLLVPSSVNLKVKENKENVYIQDLSKYEVKSFEQVIMIMNYGEEHRMYRETSIHEHSSRSHTIFRVYIESKDQSSCKYGCLNLVDLAGSERLNEFEVKAHEQLGETGHINKSLFILANVINKLAEGRVQHIPYRDSKLTRVLSQAIGGNSLSAIICTISPAAMNLNQTLSTLRFALRAKAVQNDIHVNEVLDESAQSAQMKFEIVKLRDQLEQSKYSHVKIEGENRELIKQLQIYIEEAREAKNHLNIFKNSSHDLPNKQLLEALEEEKAKRLQLEKEFEAQNQQLINLMNHFEESGNPSSGPGSSEIYFIDNMITTIQNELSQELSSSVLWQSKSKDLAMSYRQDITDLQDQYSTALSQLLGESVPIPSRGSSVIGDGEIIFCDIKPDFSEVIKEFKQKSEKPEILMQKLKAQYEEYFEKIDNRLEEARSSLAAYYQNQISKPNLDKATINNLASQHSEMLQELKSQNQEIAAEVEKEYMQALTVFNQSLTPRLKDKSKESPRIAVQFVNDSLVPYEGIGYSWGSGKDGRCGTGNEDSVQSPFKIFKDPIRLVSLKCGYHHSAAVTSDGKLYTWGRGLFGQLGHENNEIYKIPTLVSKLENIKIVQVSCGWQHTVCLSSTGKVFSWGYGEDGQLGHGDCKDYLTPKEILGLQDTYVSMVSCGHSHSGCIGDKKAYMWGCNPDARCFVVTSGPAQSPVKININKPSSLDLGLNHSAVVTEDGKLFVAGLAQEGQLGIASNGFVQSYEVPMFGEKNRAEMAVCGDAFTIVLNSKGEVFSFGKAAHGRTGRGSIQEVYEPGIIKLPEPAKSISAGCRHAGAVGVSGSLYLWGFNYYHQLGFDSDDKDVDIPIKSSINEVISLSCGYFHTMVLRAI